MDSNMQFIDFELKSFNLKLLLKESSQKCEKLINLFFYGSNGSTYIVNI